MQPWVAQSGGLSGVEQTLLTLLVALLLLGLLLAVITPVFNDLL